MKKLISLIITIVMLVLCLPSCASAKGNFAVIEVKDYGKIVVELYPDVAPKTVKNFKKLASSGFYDGLIFHRVIEGFMIQGGDPEGTGMGGAKKTVKGEFASNGFRNTLSHERGVISMARSNDKDSASSQFFICHEDSVFLNGNYASFGKVVHGIEVVDAIAAVATDSSDKPLNNVVMEKVYLVATLEEAISAE